ncbi:Imidazolonepropionate hydrolase [Aphelenchoides fujianensis]|nr:Imidazolonepropionate hydrolase [Aphelenchoides fujianensis]
MNAEQLKKILQTDPFDPLIERADRPRDPSIAHAPKRNVPLNEAEKKLAVSNVLRYVPAETSPADGRRIRGRTARVWAHLRLTASCLRIQLNAIPIDEIPARSRQAAAMILMICNNLSPDVAQFPQELVTYGGNGQVFSNWIQFRLVLRYLSEMTDEQTLSLYSGHPLGLFPSHKRAPRVVITNGMMIPNYSTKELYDKFFALNVTMYGQMTAGYLGIVHGTTITVMNAGRKYLSGEMAGKVFVSAGLGGMSGAQPKAAKISGCIGVIAEEHREKKSSISIGYLGNVVDLWSVASHFLLQTAGLKGATGREKELLVELGSDQTSCHNPFAGGYYPAGLSFEEANELMASDQAEFKKRVQKSLIRQIEAIQKLTDRGMHFFDYGNAFLLECHRAGAKILAPNAQDDKSFVYPSYMQDIMGDIFSLGFGPFRWVCASNEPEDLQTTDRIASEVLNKLAEDESSAAIPFNPGHILHEKTRQQYADNQRWIREAEKHKLVVGSQARILYSDQIGRIQIALAFNRAVREKKLKGPIVISRDHHDVSGTDSPFRETSNITDGSAYTADMAVQNVIGDAFRGATWVSLHNGGGVGWGDVMNGGFGLGARRIGADERARLMLTWDVANGVARRSWSGNEHGRRTILRTMELDERIKVTVPEVVDEKILEKLQF